jgi:hypothetical protein
MCAEQSLESLLILRFNRFFTLLSDGHSLSVRHLAIFEVLLNERFRELLVLADLRGRMF